MTTLSTIICECCSQLTATEQLQQTTFEYGSQPQPVILTVIVPVIHCESCDLEYTDQRAETIRQDAISTYLANKILRHDLYLSTTVDEKIQLHKGCCGSCPFKDGVTEVATMSQNYGCLPSMYDIIAQHIDHNGVWECHSVPNKVCSGLTNFCKVAKMDIPDKVTVGETFGTWVK